MVHHNFWCAPEYLSEEGRGKPSQTPKFFPALPGLSDRGVFYIEKALPTPILGCAVTLKSKIILFDNMYRLLLIQIIFIGIAVILWGKMMQLQLFDFGQLKNKAYEMRSKKTQIFRGEILDRNGVKLATDGTVYDIPDNGIGIFVYDNKIGFPVDLGYVDVFYVGNEVSHFEF